MKKAFLKTLSLLLTLALLAGAVPAFTLTANADAATFTYADITGGIKITGCSNVAEVTDLVIPVEIGGKTVLEIGASAFKNCAGIETLVFAEGSAVKTIGKEAFRGTGLVSAALPDSVESIADGAFKYDYSLASLTFGSGLKSVGEYAFSNTAITSVTLPDSLETVGKAAFFQCYSLASVDLAKVKAISSDAFEYTALTAVVFPETLETVAEGAFKHDTSLTTVTLNTALTAIGENAFSDGLPETVVYPDTRKTWNERGGWGYLGVTEQNNPDLYAAVLDCVGDFSPDTAIAISGTERYGATLTAEVTDMPDDVTDAVISWYNDSDDLLGTGDTYVVDVTDVGAAIKAVLSSVIADQSIESDCTGTIGKALIEGYTKPTAASITYPQKLGDATLSGGDTGAVEGVWEWVTPDVQPTSAQSGSSFELTFTPTGDCADRYEPIRTRLAVIITPAPFEPQTIEDAASGVTLEADFAQNVEATLTDITFKQDAYVALLRASGRDASGLGKLMLLKTVAFTINGEATDEAYSGTVTVKSYVGERYAGSEYSVWFFIDGETVNYVGTVDYDGILVIDGVTL